jgi:soluble lytic murein transglycosylase-like protein
MANNFKITISAVDNATASVKKINDSISRMTRPFANVQRSMKSLGTEIGKNPVVKGLVGIERAAQGVAASVARIAAPMAAIIGVGSVAGVAALATGWGRLGFEIGTTSATIGVSTSSLQAWRGAAQLAGISSEQMTGTLQAFGTTMQDVFYNRNPHAKDLMNILGVQLHQTADGAIDTNRAMLDLADTLNGPKFKGKAQEQGLIARTLSADGALPLLRKGRAEILRMQREAADLNPIKGNAAIESAEAFTKQLFRMGVAVDGLKTSIGSALMPVLEPMVQKLTSLVAMNRDVIGNEIGKWAKNFGETIKGIKLDDVNKNIQEVGRSFLWMARQVNDAAAALERFDKFTAQRAKGLEDESRKYGPRMNLPGQWSKGLVKPAPDAPGAPQAGDSTAGGGRGMSPGAMGVDPRKLGYNHPILNSYASEVEKTNKLPSGILNAIKNYGERSGSNAVSPAGARGVMQFMPKTWAQYGKGDPTDPYASIDAGGRYFKDMLKRYGGNTDAALAEYNGGTDQAKAVMAGQKPWKAETAHYLPRVKAGMEAINGQPSQEQKLTLVIEGLPAGVTAKVRDKDGESVPVRTAYPMATFGS